jgi:hypothetical protein
VGESLPPDPKTETTQGDAAGREPEGSAVPSVVPLWIGGRYQVLDRIGRGGTATVYSVLDVSSGRELALKRLAVAPGERRFAEHAAAFEREYHALIQLSHPRIIEVHDFGADEGRRYYTMELLDGGDLRELSPLPWQRACALVYDVCSSLALLHSRQLVHRDVSPRNVRRTRDGSAKLIDFGALAPFGSTQQVVGTPPFVAPEVLHRSALDARTDLFSLGATLYFALTGRFAYPARDFASLHEIWGRRPPPPSALVADLPLALDTLVQSLISLDPALRPRTAFEVMQRLAAIAGLERDEAADVPQAYVTTPTMVGREDALAELKSRIARLLAGRGGSTLIHGAAGVGRSRMLDACALDAKLAGAVVLRANAARASDGALAVGQALALQVVEALPALAVSCAEQRRVGAILFESLSSGAAAGGDARPVLKNLIGPEGDRALIQSALTGWLLQVARAHPLVVLVDDAQRADEASLALLAALVLGAPGRKLLVVATTESGAPGESAEAFAVLKRECKQLALPALQYGHVEALLGSVFGDVPNLALIADRLFAAGAGNPRETMELVQSLIARGLVRYESGQWVLPGQLPLSDLPGHGAGSYRQRLLELAPLARLLAELLALASHPSLSRADLALAAPEVPAQELDGAITDLLAMRVLADDGHAFTLARREWCDALLACLDQAGRAQRHRVLAEIYARDEAFAVERADQLLASGADAEALDVLALLLVRTAADSQGLLRLTKLRAERLALLLDRALDAAERLQRTPREVHAIRRALLAMSISTDEAHYYRAAPAWLAQLRRDSGLAHYEASAGGAAERLARALAHAREQHAATPEEQRVYGPDHAIRGLVYYVAVSIAIGSRAQDAALLASLPAVLEPFAPLSPLIDAVWQNAIATRETVVDNRLEHAHRRWLDVLAVLATVTSVEVSYVTALRGAISYGLASIEARLGLPSAEERARSLDDDPLQRVSAMSLRRVARLHKGDFAGAERLRKQVEVQRLRANVRQMFTNTLPAELIAYALAADLGGIREMVEAIRPLAARFAGWLGYKHLAEGYFEQVCGRAQAARAAFERGLAVSEPDPADARRTTAAWPRLEGAYIEVLVQLGCAEQARGRGLFALERCAQLEIGLAAFVIRRALALAEAKLGDFDSASARLEDVARELTALGIRGLELGATYEARARVAIWAADAPAIERYGKLTAEEYRYGEGSPLGARYVRLMDEARDNGMVVPRELTEFQSKLMTASLRGSVSSAMDPVSEAQRTARSEDQVDFVTEAEVGGAER